MDARNTIHPHLLLFVDINGTIIVNDSVKNKDVDSAILQLLAENYSAVWDPTKTTEIMTYRKFIEKHLLIDSITKKARTEDYQYFIEFLEKIKHPLQTEILENFKKMKVILSACDVFPSFLKLIHDLQENKTPFTLILRSFGTDAKNVIEFFKEKTNLTFPNQAIFKSGSLIDDKHTLKKPSELLKSIQIHQHGSWQDDYHYWHSHQEMHDFGKPFPIDIDSKDTLSIFFDDNATDKQILSVQPTSKDVPDQFKLQDKLIKLGRIVPVNTMKAILDENYFKNCVDFALQQQRLAQTMKSSDCSIFQSRTVTSQSGSEANTLQLGLN